MEQLVFKKCFDYKQFLINSTDLRKRDYKYTNKIDQMLNTDKYKKRRLLDDMQYNRKYPIFQKFEKYSPDIKPEDFSTFVVEKLDGTFDPIGNCLYIDLELLEDVEELMLMVNSMYESDLIKVDLKPLRISDQKFKKNPTMCFKKLREVLKQRESKADVAIVTFLYSTGCKPEFLHLVRFEDLTDNRTLKYWDTITETYKELKLDKVTHQLLKQLQESKMNEKKLSKPRYTYNGEKFEGTFIFDITIKELWKKFEDKFDTSINLHGINPLDMMIYARKFRKNCQWKY